MANQPPEKSPYVVLSVARSASAEEVRRAYRQKVLETHPDKLPQTATEAERDLAKEQFQIVHEAFEILNDPLKRRAYDIHVRPLPDYIPTPKQWEEAQARRSKDRQEWIKKSDQRLQDHRLKTFKRIAEEQIQNIQQCTTTAQKTTMAEKMLQDLYSLNPEWEIRRQKAQAYKASCAQSQF